MIEEEIIKEIQNLIKYYNGDIHELPSTCFKLSKALKGLLDLYNKEKEIIKIRNANIKLLLEGYSKIAKELNIKSFAINGNIVINHVKENYISKDKIREKIKYYEQKKKDLLGLPDDCAKMIASEDCDEKLYIYKELLEE